MSRDSSLPLIMKAIHHAAGKHKNQARKGLERAPYINHPIEVAFFLSEYAGIDDPEVLAAAILHDVLEDTDTRAKEIEEEFGKRVRSLVEELTDDKELAKEVRKRKQVEHAHALSEEASQIKIADKLSNIGDISDSPPAGWNLERRMAYLDWSEEVVDKLQNKDPNLESVYRQRLADSRNKLEAEMAKN